MESLSQEIVRMASVLSPIPFHSNVQTGDIMDTASQEATSFELSQSQSPEELTNMTQALETILAIAKGSLAIQNCRKPVHFVKNLNRRDELVIWVVNTQGDQPIFSQRPTFSWKEIVDCDYLVISATNPERLENAEFQIVDGVKIILAEAQGKPHRITFRSGNTYVLSDGYSVTYCGNLAVTAQISLYE